MAGRSVSGDMYSKIQHDIFKNKISRTQREYLLEHMMGTIDLKVQIESTQNFTLIGPVSQRVLLAKC